MITKLKFRETFISSYVFMYFPINTRKTSIAYNYLNNVNDICNNTIYVNNTVYGYIYIYIYIYIYE